MKVFALLSASLATLFSSTHAQLNTVQFPMQAAPNLCLDIRDGRLQAHTRVQLWHCDMSNINQQFLMHWDDTIRLRADPSLCLNAQHGLQDGNDIILYPCEAGPNDTWVIRTGSDGTIRPRANQNLCLNVQDGYLQPGSDLQLWFCSAAHNERFMVNFLV